MTEQAAYDALVMGAGVYVNGRPVAWFATFDQAASDWCTENYFGRWLIYKSTAPMPVPKTKEELEDIQKRAAELWDWMQS